MSCEAYIKALKPIPMTKSRASDHKLAITEGERRQLRGFMGSLAWPSNQAAPHLQRSVSLGQGSINAGSTVQDAEVRQGQQRRVPGVPQDMR
eukprot:8498153-Pyramimonas_sp.AAC.1